VGVVRVWFRRVAKARFFAKSNPKECEPGGKPKKERTLPKNALNQAVPQGSAKRCGVVFLPGLSLVLPSGVAPVSCLGYEGGWTFPADAPFIA
jgi:hypothetical protein